MKDSQTPLEPAAYDALRKEANSLRRSIKRSLAECRDRIAYREGFVSWAHMDAALAKSPTPTGAPKP